MQALSVSKDAMRGQQSIKRAAHRRVGGSFFVSDTAVAESDRVSSRLLRKKREPSRRSDISASDAAISQLQ